MSYDNVGPVLILTPTGRDAEGAARLLAAEEFEPKVVTDVGALCSHLTSRAPAIGAVLVADEAITSHGARNLIAQALEHQPPWSDVPFVILTHPTPRNRNPLLELRLPEALGNVMFLERPLNVLTLVSAVRTSLRARRRQLQIRDHIEAQAKAAALLQQRTAILEAVSNTTSNLIFVKDNNSRLLFANPATLAAIGLPESQALGRNEFERHGATRETAEIVENDRRIIASQAAETIEETFTGPHGTRSFLVTKTPMHDATGAVTGLVGVSQDITDRLMAEAALKRSEAALRDLNATLEQRISAALAERELLAKIIESTDAFVLVSDLNYNLLAINKAAADEFKRIYGVRPYIGNNLLGLLADQPEHRAAVESFWSRALVGEEFTATAEFGEPTRDRRYYELKFNALRDVTGTRIGAYQFAYDVTQRIRDQERLQHAENVLRENQKMESIGQLTGGVAHDFNNLLAVIKSGLQILERHTDPERRKLAMDGMRHAITRGAGLTRQLLAFSRRRPLHPEPLDLAAQIKGLQELLSRSLRGDIKIVMTFAPNLWPVEVDAGELELAILNLCVNSRDAMPDGGVITITAENFGAAVPFVRLSVADTGVGMPDAVLKRAFEPFFTTKDVGRGSGLGLAQVYGFAKQSGGQVEIDSTPGRGTTVSLRLPKSKSQPRVASPAEVAPAKAALPASGKVVLLVEDDTDVAALAQQMLETIGYTVMHVDTARAALGALANGRNIDIVFSDIMMPGGMNGVDLAREIRKRHSNLPVVLTTGFQNAAAGAQADGIGVLLKPYDIDDLAGLLSESIRSAQAQAVSVSG
jgi:PAS domain S-box-containing protein